MKSWIVLSLGFLPAFTYAQGVSDKEIRLGSCSGLTSTVKDLARAHLDGGEAYFNYLNDHGGINGRRIKLFAEDDGYDPEKAIACFNKLQEEDVLAGTLFQGTPPAVKHVVLAEMHKMPIVGIFSPSEILHKPFKKYVFTVRVSSEDQINGIIDGLWDKPAMHKIAVIFQDDALGVGLLKAVKAVLAKRGADVVAQAFVARGSLDVKDAVEQTKAAKPDAVFLACTYPQAAEVAKLAQAAGWKPVFAGVAGWSEQYIEKAGDAAEGTLISQLVPSLDRTDLPSVKLYRKLLKEYFPQLKPDVTGFEGFIDAMVVAEALKRAGKDLNRESFMNALESLHDFDVGLGPEFRVSFSADRHKGFSHDYLTIVRGKKSVRFSDWAELAQR